MTSQDSHGGDPPTDAEASQPLEEVAKETVDTLENPPRDRIEAAKAMDAAIREFATAAGRAVADDPSTNVETWISAVAGASRDVRKGDVRDRVDKQIDEHSQDENGQDPLDDWIETHVEKVTIVRTTDAKQNTLFRWHLDTGGVVETETTKDGIAHFRPDTLQNRIYEETGVLPGKPTDGRRSGDDWKQYIVGFVDRVKNEVTATGNRTVAHEKLKNWVQQNPAYHDLQDALEAQAMRYDPDEDEIHIPRHHISRITDQVEITNRAFQVELDARGVLSDRVAGASESTRISYGDSVQYVSYWVLDLDALDGDPYEIIDERETAAEKAAREETEDTDDDEEQDADVDPEGYLGGITQPDNAEAVETDGGQQELGGDAGGSE